MNKKHGIKKVNNSFQDTMMSVLGIEITDIGESYVSGKMPVDNRTKQPFGLLHGGASAAFAETLGSIGAGKHVDLEEYSVVGVELNSSHLKAVRTGWVFGKATPIRVGRTMQVWDIDIKNQEDDLICKSRLTLAVIKKNDK
ncbi:MAG: hotdog fold thioesterase [Candidatus Neomarinimicrobiota bacterium]